MEDATRSLASPSTNDHLASEPHLQKPLPKRRDYLPLPCIFRYVPALRHSGPFLRQKKVAHGASISKEDRGGGLQIEDRAAGNASPTLPSLRLSREKKVAGLRRDEKGGGLMMWIFSWKPNVRACQRVCERLPLQGF